MIETIGKPNEDRDPNDFYATDPKAVDKLFELENIKGFVLENSVGDGHIAKKLIEKGCSLMTFDIIERNYNVDIIGDFLSHPVSEEESKAFDCAVYNPPFKSITEFILKTWEFTDVQYVFARIQLLETGKRYNELFKNGWLEKVYVFSSRMTTAKGGNNSLFGKNNSMCFAWFKFNKNFKGKTTIEWC
jgi:hypothetical protein